MLFQVRSVILLERSTPTPIEKNMMKGMYLYGNTLNTVNPESNGAAKRVPAIITRIESAFLIPLFDTKINPTVSGR